MTSATAAPRGRRGRPRSAAADRDLLDAVRSLVVELGYSELTMEGVAARAGVAKTTLYRRWTTKADLVVDAVVDTLTPLYDAPDDAAPEELLRTLADALSRPEARAAFLSVLSEAAVDPLIHDRVQARLIEPARALVARCAAKAEIELDSELLFDVLAGAVIHRVLIQGRERPTPGHVPRRAARAGALPPGSTGPGS